MADGFTRVATRANEAAERAEALTLQACVGLMSPWVDLTLTSATLDSKADVDPLLSKEALRRRADDYVTPADARARTRDMRVTLTTTLFILVTGGAGDADHCVLL